jgi:predicted dehydrogenase
MRFHPAIKKIKELVDSGIIGKSLAFTYHSGQYLPDWHPWEDYRKFYVAKRATGAGREIVPFELVWLVWVFGGVETISCFKGKLTKMEVDIDDTYQTIMKFKNDILGHLLVDVIARAAYRVFRLLGEDGVIEWDWSTRKIRVFTVKDKKWTEHSTEEGTPEKGYIIGEKMYIDEMDSFIKAIKGGKYPYSFEDDKKILETLYAAEKSSDNDVHVDIS